MLIPCGYFVCTTLKEVMYFLANEMFFSLTFLHNL